MSSTFRHATARSSSVPPPAPSAPVSMDLTIMPSRLSDLERSSPPPPPLEKRAGRRRLLGYGMTTMTAASALIALLWRLG